MRIGRVDPGTTLASHRGEQEIRQGELVSLGGKVTPEVRRPARIIPADLNVMR